MARPVRMNYPDTFYHVLSRGNERKDIFRLQEDYKRFKETIGRMVKRFDIEIHGYVLMSNHYHLLIRTRQGNLSRAIQWLGLTYSMWFNRRYDRIGHRRHVFIHPSEPYPCWNCRKSFRLSLEQLSSLYVPREKTERALVENFACARNVWWQQKELYGGTDGFRYSGRYSFG